MVLRRTPLEQSLAGFQHSARNAATNVVPPDLLDVLLARLARAEQLELLLGEWQQRSERQGLDLGTGVLVEVDGIHQYRFEALRHDDSAVGPQQRGVVLTKRGC